MADEIRKYDRLAKYLYDLHHLDDEDEHFNHLPRKERDYWRALAQVAYVEGMFPLDPVHKPRRTPPKTSRYKK